MMERSARRGLGLDQHVLRHACGYALAAKGHDTRAIQQYLASLNHEHGGVHPPWRRTGSGIFGGSKFAKALGIGRASVYLTLVRLEAASFPEPGGGREAF
jgi:hypothetical protein